MVLNDTPKYQQTLKNVEDYVYERETPIDMRDQRLNQIDNMYRKVILGEEDVQAVLGN